jgi:Kef-type K+ transport system membrane component KefB
MYLDIVIFAVFVFIYSAIAGAVERTWISGAIIFTAFGLLIGPLGLDLISFEADGETIRTLAELTLALVLFTDAAGVHCACRFEREHRGKAFYGLVWSPGACQHCVCCHRGQCQRAKQRPDRRDRGLHHNA